jgi:tRNA (guanine37-N1)-methyltransferase
MHIGVVSLFPEMVRQACGHGICGRALEAGLLQLTIVNPRDFTDDKHRTVDDRPYGGGPGMVLMVAPLRRAIAAAREVVGPDARVVYLSPQGRRFDQARVEEFVSRDSFILVCGRYEGIDERLLALEVDEELSIGDFVLSGGEVPALAVIDAVTRQIPGALGHDQSAANDSFAEGLLDWPHFTRPEVVDGLSVPAVLLSGHHGAIETWRLQQALGRTAERRPDLMQQRELSKSEQALLALYQAEQSEKAE